MTDAHVHAEGGLMKMRTMVVTRVEKNGHPGYRVESVMNSVEYYPPQVLEVSEVARLCDDERWQVTVVPAPPGRP